MNMYQDKFVVAIKSGGKILRETKDLVRLPFGSEFSVLVKNLNSRRAKCTLHIDGQDVLDGTSIIVDANSEIEMKRFIRDGNMNEGNAFKFIERTKAVEDGPHGVKIDDGVIRVEFWFEKQAPIVNEVTTIHHTKYRWWDEYYRTYPRRTYWYDDLKGPYYESVQGATARENMSSGVSSKGMTRSATVRDLVNQGSADIPSTSATAASMPDVNEIGITVPGSKIEQKFHTVYSFNAEDVSNVIILRMTGMIGDVEIISPVTVKTKTECITCGLVNKSNANYCPGCGTALLLL